MARRTTIENAQMVLTDDETDQAYQFEWVTSITLTDPRENVLAVSNQDVGDGVVYRTGTGQAGTADMIVRDVPANIFKLMKAGFQKQKRFTLMIFDKQNGDQHDVGKAIIRSNPSNTTIADGDASLDVPLNLSFPPARWDHKPAE
ncbi:TPA: hypothetical protein P0E12_004990 [Vibrio harveyi]|nr:hypothetical protein [Vibrio harveyi]